MKIQKKLLSAFLGIVLIFAVVGTIMTLNTLQVAYLQKEANTQAQIGSYATTYQMGIDMKKYAYLEGSTGNIEASKADDAMANAIIEPAEAWLLENIPKDSELYAEFYSCYEINHNTIAGISSEIAYIFDNELTDRYVEVDTVYTPQLETAYDQITYNLMQFQASVMDNIEQTNKEVQNFSNISVMTAGVGVSVGCILSIALAIILGKRIATPIKQLTDVAGKVSMGELDHQINIESKDKVET